MHAHRQERAHRGYVSVHLNYADRASESAGRLAEVGVRHPTTTHQHPIRKCSWQTYPMSTTTAIAHTVTTQAARGFIFADSRRLA